MSLLSGRHETVLERALAELMRANAQAMAIRDALSPEADTVAEHTSVLLDQVRRLSRGHEA